MKNYIIAALVVALVVLVLWAFSPGGRISVTFLPGPTATLTDRQKVAAPYETVKAEIDQLHPTPAQ